MGPLWPWPTVSEPPGRCSLHLPLWPAVSGAGLQCLGTRGPCWEEVCRGDLVVGLRVGKDCRALPVYGRAEKPDLCCSLLQGSARGPAGSRALGLPSPVSSGRRRNRSLWISGDPWTGSGGEAVLGGRRIRFEVWRAGPARNSHCACVCLGCLGLPGSVCPQCAQLCSVVLASLQASVELLYSFSKSELQVGIPQI